MTDPSRMLAERYDRDAEVYRELWAPILRRASLRILPRLAPGVVRHVLDVGTGVGSLLPDLAGSFPGARIVGLDRSRGMLAHVPRAFDRVTMDAGALGFRTGSFDRVLMLFMLFHLPSPGDGLREARRVLRPGGTAAIITWAGELESDATRAWTSCLDAHGADPLDPATATRHDRVDTIEKLEALLAQAGFTAVACWMEQIVERLDADLLVRLRTGVGSSRLRFGSLTAEAGASCLREARRVLERLPSEAFVARAKLVYAVAGVPSIAVRTGGRRKE